jgi:hypothetical protein
MNKIGRTPIKITESLPFSEVILLVASDQNYPQKIAEIRKTKPSAIVKQLDILKRKKFLNNPVKEKLLNKTLYTVNFNKINEEFIEFIKKRLNQSQSLNKNLIPLNINLNVLNDKKVYRNSYLTALFKIVFNRVGLSHEKVSINHLFDIMIKYDLLSKFSLINSASEERAVDKINEEGRANSGNPRALIDNQTESIKKSFGINIKNQGEEMKEIENLREICERLKIDPLFPNISTGFQTNKLKEMLKKTEKN